MSDSALPFNVSDDPFPNKIRGTFGRFVTNESHELHFIQSQIPIGKIHWLMTSSQAFDISTVDFEQLIQRDIDWERVQTIVDSYLKAGKNRVIFFPPLLVSVLPVDENNAPLNTFTKVDEDVKNKQIVRTFDSTRFQVSLPISDGWTGSESLCKGETYKIFDFGTLFEYNPSSVRLVVIDGQHRLSALKKLSESKEEESKRTVKNINVPICIVFSPDAIEGAKNEESIVKDLRELFVRINTTSKLVSGHFITLLKDNSLSSLAVRSMADIWKSRGLRGYDHLHLMEWNQRETRRASQVQRPYSITTVSIVGDALESYLFDTKPNRTRHFLALEEIEEKLMVNGESYSIGTISEENFHPNQAEILQARIKEIIAPSMDVLFSEPEPYKRCADEFLKATEWLDSEIGKGTKGAESFKADVLGQHRSCNKLDPTFIKPVEEEFESRISQGLADIPRTYFFNMFQNGYIQGWCRFATLGMRYGLNLRDCAIALVGGLNGRFFSPEAGIASPARSYTQRVLFNGDRIILRQGAKDQWTNLVLLSLLSPRSIEHFEKALGTLDHLSDESRSALLTAVLVLAKTASDDFFSEFRDRTEADYEKSWRDKDLDETLLSKLEELSEKDDEESKEEFHSQISKLTTRRVEDAKAALSNVLLIRKEILE